MAFWCAGLIVGVSFGRARGKPGIFGGGLGAALGCGLATLILYDENFAIVSMFNIVSGWLLAVFAATVYHALLTGLIETYWRQRLIRRTALVLGSLLIAGLVAWQVGQRTIWRPTWEQQLDKRNYLSVLSKMVLSPQGNRLAENTGSSGDFFSGIEEAVSGRVFELTPRGLVQGSVSLPWGSDAAFSPDGTQIALGRGPHLQLYDAQDGTSIWERTLDLNSLEVVLQHQFSADGRQLYITTHTPRIQRLRVIEVNGGLEAGLELFPFAGHLYVSDRGDKLIKFLAATDENNEQSVEVMNLASRETICRLPDISQIERPVFSLSGDRLALGSREWSIPDGRSRPAGGKVIGLLSNGRALVVDQDSPDSWRSTLPYWLQQMPFVRHLRSGDHLSQLRISDETGQTILATPWLDNIHQVELSANQHVVLSASRHGLIRIWKVPE